MERADRHPPGLAWDVLDSGALAGLADEWDRVVTTTGYPAFMRATFFVHALRRFGCNEGRLVLGRDGGHIVAAGLLTPLGKGQWLTYQPSQLPLGAWVMTPECSWRRALPSLLQALPGVAVSLSVTQQDPRFVARPLSAKDCEVMDYVATGWIDVAGSFDEFWQARGKNLRQNLRKLRRRLEEESGMPVFEFIERPDDVDAAVLEFAALESAGWKAEKGTALSADNVQGSFYRGVLREYAAQGAGFALRLSVGGRPIAVDFGVRDQESLVLLKTTYDENYRAYSPAQLLHEQAFEHIFGSMLARRIEFYGKLMEWHTRWTEQSRTLFHLNFYRSPLLRIARNLVKCARLRPIRLDHLKLAAG